jgi:hypothetical protein
MRNFLKPEIVNYEIMDKYLNTDLRSSDRTILSLALKGWGILHIGVSANTSWRSKTYFITPQSKNLNYVVPVGVVLNIVFMNMFGRSAAKVKIGEAGVEPPSIPSAPIFRQISASPARIYPIKFMDIPVPPVVKADIFSNRFNFIPAGLSKLKPSHDLPKFSIARNQYRKWKTHNLELDVTTEARTFISRYRRDKRK